MDQKTATATVEGIMHEFAHSTGIIGEEPPRDNLCTDAFAVCNLPGLSQRNGDQKYRQLASRLVNQVHNVLGRHRHDDPRCGWLSGLSEEAGAKHPTQGGLRKGGVES